MKLKISFLVTMLAIFFMAKTEVQAQVDTHSDTDFNELSETFLQRIIDKKDTQDLQDILANTSISELDNALDTNDKRLAFWLNIYNAYIQVILQKNPELYDDRGSFFKLEQIKIVGEMVSFAKIEHGII